MTRRRPERNRPPMLQAERQRIFRRDGYRCQLCGVTIFARGHVGDPRKGTVDHIVRVSEGGATVDANLRTACDECNQERG